MTATEGRSATTDSAERLHPPDGQLQFVDRATGARGVVPRIGGNGGADRVRSTGSTGIDNRGAERRWLSNHTLNGSSGTGTTTTSISTTSSSRPNRQWQRCGAVHCIDRGPWIGTLVCCIRRSGHESDHSMSLGDFGAVDFWQETWF